MNSSAKLIIANWKSNKSRTEVESWLSDFERESTQVAQTGHQVVLAPAMPSLELVADRLQDQQRYPNTHLGVQDISPFPAGSYTGAISTRTLDGFRVKYAIVGHSERRRYFHESHQDIANKVSQCLEAGITPVVCLDDEYIAAQAAAIASDQLKACVVAYEELSAIGSGHNKPVEHVVPVVERIKHVFGQIRVLYGGSVTPANAGEYLEVCDGVLVGGASLDAKKFVAIILG